MKLTAKQKTFLRGLGHKLKPVVMLGNAGLTDAVTAEIEKALEHHELIKIKISGADREDRKAIIDRICADSVAVLVQSIGNVALVYRERSKDRKIILP